MSNISRGIDPRPYNREIIRVTNFRLCVMSKVGTCSSHELFGRTSYNFGLAPRLEAREDGPPAGLFGYLHVELVTKALAPRTKDTR